MTKIVTATGREVLRMPWVATESERHWWGGSGSLERFSSAPQQDLNFSRAGNVRDTKYLLRASSHTISIKSLENKWNHSVPFWKHLVFQTESFQQMNSKIYLCPCVIGIAWGGGRGNSVCCGLAFFHCHLYSTLAFSWVSQHFKMPSCRSWESHLSGFHMLSLHSWRVEIEFSGFPWWVSRGKALWVTVKMG